MYTMGTQAVGTLAALDDAPLTPRYWNATAAVMVAMAFEFFDFFVIGFIVSQLSNEWQLDFGQIGAVLYAAGIGAMVGGTVGGWAGSRFGRKWPFVVGIAGTALSSGAIAFAPIGAVWYLIVFRFLVGSGVGLMFTSGQTIVVELTPVRHRTYLAGFAASGVGPLGTLAAALLSASLLDVIGWRGLAAIGFLPLAVCVWAAIAIPESPRWLLEQGRGREANSIVAKFTGRPPSAISPVAAERIDNPRKDIRSRSGYLALHKNKRGALFLWAAWFGAATALYGVALWGPTIFAQALSITSSEAARLYVWVGLAGFGGRAVFAFLPHWLGRRVTGLIAGAGGGVILFVGALLGGTVGTAAAILVISIVAANFFVDGGFTNLGPAGLEIYPTSLRSHAMGLGQIANGLGKIVGPLALAVIAGTSNVVTPQATADAITPGLIFLGVFALLPALAFLFFPETRGKTLEDVHGAALNGRPVAPPK